MQSCGMQVAKYLLFGFNLIFALSGLLIVICGAVVLAMIDDFRTFMESRIVGPPIVLIIAGLIIFIIAFLGCWGALQENSNMLIAYAVLLLIIFIVEFAVGITAAVARDDFDITMESAMHRSMAQYGDDSIQKVTWDTMQEKLQCCGVHKKDDWPKHLNNGAVVPSSCCIEKGKSCDNTTATSSMYFSDGCYFKLRDKVKSGALVLAGVGIGIAFIELAGIVLALLLVHSIRKSTQK